MPKALAIGMTVYTAGVTGNSAVLRSDSVWPFAVDLEAADLYVC